MYCRAEVVSASSVLAGLAVLLLLAVSVKTG